VDVAKRKLREEKAARRAARDVKLSAQTEKAAKVVTKVLKEAVPHRRK
jgi:hypothetical protein